MKYRLNYTKPHNTFRAYYLERFFSRWFDTRPFDIRNTLEPHDILVYSLPEWQNQMQLQDIPVDVLDRVSAILVDNLQEADFPQLGKLHDYAQKVLIITAGHGHRSCPLRLLIVPEWFWYFESLWYRSRNYHLYRPSGEPKTRLFFMPIRRCRPGRDLIYHGVQSLLDRSIYSYVEKGIRLPGIPEENREDQRWFNPYWYDSTYFSLVCEDDDDSYPVMWSEKTCKPLAFFHPFVLAAQRGLLALVHEHGFESFPELFDESYDQLPDITQRAAAVCKSVNAVNLADFDAPEISAKIQHNHDRFFDAELVEQRIVGRLIEPLLSFLATAR